MGDFLAMILAIVGFGMFLYCDHMADYRPVCKKGRQDLNAEKVRFK